MATSTPPARARGFTLVETLMVAVVLGVAAVGVARLQGNLFKSQSDITGLQVRTALMLGCAEQVLGWRRFHANGYETLATGTDFGTNLCGAESAYGGYTVPTVTITDPYTGTGCPSGGICKLVSISQAGMTSLTVMMVDY
jgi:prepilin-type N-terminal cleavage/methylation domain-containing protein